MNWGSLLSSTRAFNQRGSRSCDFSLETHECLVNNNKLLRALCCILNPVVYCDSIDASTFSSVRWTSLECLVREKKTIIIYVMQISVHKQTMTIIKRRKQVENQQSSLKMCHFPSDLIVFDHQLNFGDRWSHKALTFVPLIFRSKILTRKKCSNV